MATIFVCGIGKSFTRSSDGFGSVSAVQIFGIIKRIVHTSAPNCCVTGAVIAIVYLVCC